MLERSSVDSECSSQVLEIVKLPLRKSSSYLVVNCLLSQGGCTGNQNGVYEDQKGGVRGSVPNKY